MSLQKWASLVLLAKRLSPTNKRGTRAEEEVTRPRQPPRTAQLTPLPRALSNRMPQELFERVIDHLYNDAPALSSCSLVCHAWRPASWYHLFGSLTIRPRHLDVDPALQVNCCVALPDLEGQRRILYGTDEGVYMAQLTPGARPLMVLFVPEVTHIDVFEDKNLLVLISAHQVMTIPLDALSPTTPKDAKSCSRVSSHASFFKIGLCMGKPLVCVVKSGLASTTFKILEPVLSPHTQHYGLQPYREFYISAKCTSVHFLRAKLVAGINRHDFEVIDIGTLQTQALLDPAGMLDLKSTKCLAVHRVGEEVLVCYDAFAIYVDSMGRLSRAQRITWRTKVVDAIVFREPYMIAFSPKHIEVRYLETAELVQTIWIEHTMISTSPTLFTIRSHDSRLIGLQFAD